MPIQLRPVSLIVAGFLALAAGCAAPEAPAPKGIVLNPPAPERPRRVVAARPKPVAPPAAIPDETGLTPAQKEALFERFVESRGSAETRAADAVQ